MRARVWTMLLPLLFGCAGKNVVSGDEKTRAEKLEAIVPAWCRETCDRLDVCVASRPPCDCVSEGCSCPRVDRSCLAECAATMARFTLGNDACAAVGEGLKRCLDEASCDDVYGGHCSISEADDLLCPSLDDGSSEPPQVVAAGGMSAVAGSASIDVGGISSGLGGEPSGLGGGPSGIAGMGGTISVGGSAATGSASMEGPVVSCSAGYGSAGSAYGGAPSSLTCEEGRQYCSDGHDYDWTCVRNSQGRMGCTCFRDAQVIGGFDPGTDDCPDIALVNASCGWNLEAL